MKAVYYVSGKINTQPLEKDMPVFQPTAMIYLKSLEPRFWL